MDTTPLYGIQFVEAADPVSDYPAVSEALALLLEELHNRIRIVELTGQAHPAVNAHSQVVWNLTVGVAYAGWRFIPITATGSGVIAYRASAAAPAVDGSGVAAVYAINTTAANYAGGGSQTVSVLLLDLTPNSP